MTDDKPTDFSGITDLITPRDPTVAEVIESYRKRIKQMLTNRIEVLNKQYIEVEHSFSVSDFDKGRVFGRAEENRRYLESLK